MELPNRLYHKHAAQDVAKAMYNVWKKKPTIQAEWAIAQSHRRTWQKLLYACGRRELCTQLAGLALAFALATARA